MNEFVNFKKRSFTLPPGCKDLIDLLRPTAKAAIERAQRLTPTRNETVEGVLLDIGKYILMAFEPGGIFTLVITPPGGRLEVDVLRMRAEEPLVSVIFPNEPEEERVVRRFFTRKGLEIPEGSRTPTSFIPNLPVQVVYHVLPLPGDAAGVSALIEDFFRECGKLENNAPLKFHIEEASNAA